MTLSCLPCALFCSCPCKVCSRVLDPLSKNFCNLSLAFLADFTLSDSTAPIHFIVSYYCSLSQITLCFSFGSKDKITAFTCLLSYRYSSFTLQAYLCWRHTYCQWPIIELTKNVSPKNKMAASHVVKSSKFKVQIHTHACFPWSKKWLTYHVAIPTGNALASQRSIFRENRLNFLTFIRR